MSDTPIRPVAGAGSSAPEQHTAPAAETPASRIENLLAQIDVAELSRSANLNSDKMRQYLAVLLKPPQERTAKEDRLVTRVRDQIPGVVWKEIRTLVSGLVPRVAEKAPAGGSAPRRFLDKIDFQLGLQKGYSPRELRKDVDKRGASGGFAPPGGELYLLGLSTRVRNLLEENGIRSIGELEQRGAEELLQISGFGRESLKEVRHQLKECGLHLRGEA